MHKHNAAPSVYVGGTSIFVILTSIFAAAKVFNYSDMSWIMVLSPIWGPFLLLLSIVLVVGILTIIYSAIAHVVNNISKKSKK